MNFLKASSVKSLSWTPPSLWDYGKREAILNSGRVHPESISYGQVCGAPFTSVFATVPGGAQLPHASIRKRSDFGHSSRAGGKMPGLK